MTPCHLVSHALLASLLLTWHGSAMAQPVALKPGLWETVRVTESAAAASRQAATGRVCVKQADDASVLVPRQRLAGATCESRDVRASAAGVAWRIACTAPDGPANGTGTLTATATTYVGSGEIERRVRGAKPEKLVQTYSGKWLAASCS